MTTRRIRWLYGELPGLVRAGVLDDATAERIERHYGPVSETSARNLLVPIFGVLGALLIGAGVMLLFGHNWEELGRPLRAGLSFSLLLSAQAFAGWALWRRRDSIAWCEGSGLFLGLAIGATIALIAQTYQIPGNLKSFMLTWTLLALPIPYLLRSRVGAGLYWILATWWLTVQAWDESLSRQIGLFMLLVGLIAPFMVWLTRRYQSEARTALLLWTATACLVVAGFTMLPLVPYGLWFPVAIGFFGALYAAGLVRHEEEGVESTALWRRPLHTIGATGVAVMLFAGSFADVWRHMGPAENVGHGPGLVIAASMVALALLAFSSLRGIETWKAGQPHRALLALTPLLLTGVWGLSFGSGTEGWLMLVVNATGLIVGVAAVNAGMKGGQLGTANCGLLLVVSLVLARFFDDDWSFVIRGLGFIFMGIVFLAMNLWLVKRRREVRS
jgi:hypothetical protein